MCRLYEGPFIGHKRMVLLGFYGNGLSGQARTTLCINQHATPSWSASVCFGNGRKYRLWIDITRKMSPEGNGTWVTEQAPLLPADVKVGYAADIRAQWEADTTTYSMYTVPY